MPAGLIATTAAGIGANVIGQGMGMLLAKHNDKRQIKQQQKLQTMQIEGNRQMLEQQRLKEMQMWKDTNYGAQMNELTKAGLNPGLMYGMGGGGGVTTGGGAGAPTGATATQGGGGEMQIGMGMAMMGAQLELMKAQAKKTNVEADKIGGVDTEKTTMEIKNLAAGIENTEASTRLTKVITDIQQIEAEIKGRTKEDAITAIQHGALKIMDEARSALAQANVDETTWNTKIKMIETELAGMYLRNELTGTQIAKTETEINAIAEQLVQGWHKLNIDFANANTHRGQLELEKYIRNVRESTKLTYETVKGLVQAILLRGGR